MKKLDPTDPKFRLEFIFLIAGLMALNALAIDIMLPALGDMGSALQIAHENDQQLIITAYMLGFGAFQIFFGPPTDHFGRKMPLALGLSIYAIASIAAIFATGFGVLLALRFAQGIGAAATRVSTQAMVRDSFSGRAMAEIMSLVQMVFLIVPVLAPSIGQVILLGGEWHLIFLFIGLFSLAMLAWSMARMPETLKPANKRPLTAKSTIEGFRLVFSNRIAMGYALAASCLFGGMIGYVSTAQQVFTEVFGLGVWFPVVFGATAFGMALGALINSRIVRRFGMRRISHTGMLVYVLSGTTLAIYSLFAEPTLIFFLSCVGVCMVTIGWTAGNTISLALEPMGAVSGSASAVIGTVQMVIGSILGMIAGQTYDGTIKPIAIGFMCWGFLSLVFMLIAEKGRLFGVGEDKG